MRATATRTVKAAIFPVIAPGNLELANLAGLTLVYLLADGLVGAPSHDPLNVIGPLWLAVVLIWFAFNLARLHSAGIWTAAFWLRIAVAAYFGVGSAIPYFVNEYTRSYLDAFYEASSELMFKVNIITSVGTLLMLLSIRMMTAIFPSRRSKPLLSTDEMNRARLLMGLVFGGMGFIVKDAIVLPYALGVSTVVVNAAVLQMSQFTSVGILLLTGWALNGRSVALAIALLLTCLDAGVGLLIFNKTDTIFPLLMFVLAVVSHRPTTLRVAAGAVVIIAIFVLIKPVVDYGRAAVYSKYNSLGGASLSERVTIVANYWELGDQTMTAAQLQRREEFQSVASRFSYMSGSAFAVSLYDGGTPGDTFGFVWTVLVPRVLSPDKTNLNILGEEFNFRATGSAASLSWPGQFAEAYWNFGWWGLPIYMIPLGVLCWFLSRYAIDVFEQGRWAYFPVVIYGVKVGVDIAAPFATVVAGSLTFVPVLHVACLILERVVHSMGRPSASAGMPSAARGAHRRFPKAGS